MSAFSSPQTDKSDVPTGVEEAQKKIGPNGQGADESLEGQEGKDSPLAKHQETGSVSSVRAIIGVSDRHENVSGSAAHPQNGIGAGDVIVRNGTQDWRVDCGNVHVTLINDCSGFNEPFAAVAIESLRYGRTASGVDGAVQQAARCQMACSLFNNTVMEFEPVLEEWGFAVEHTSRAQADGVEMCQGVRVTATEVLNVNLTEAHMDNITCTLSTWRADWAGSDSSSGVKRRTQAAKGLYSAYGIQNHCGTGICVKSYWKDGAQGAPPLHIESLQSEPFFFHDRMFKRHTSEMVERMKRAKMDNSRMIYVTVAGVNGDIEEEDAGFPVPVDTLGAHIFSTTAGGKVLAEVSLGEATSTHVLTVSSLMCVRNSCHEALDFRVIDGEGKVIMSFPLAPSAHTDIPPDLCSDDLRVCMKPVLAEGSWSDAVALNPDLDRVVRCFSTDDPSTGFHARAVAKVSSKRTILGEEVETIEASLMPVLIISNLLPCAMRFTFLLEHDMLPGAR